MMLTSSSKFLQGCLLASRNSSLELHTTACVYKGASHKRKKAGSKARPTQSSSRRRLVPTLKPEGQFGTYEVAPRRSKAREEPARGGAPPHTYAASSQASKEGPSSRNEGSFAREDAPHVVRSSWQRSGSSVPFRKEEKSEYANGYSRRTPSFGLRRNDDSFSRRDGFRSRDVPFRGKAASDASHTRQNFKKRLSSEKAPSHASKYDFKNIDRPQPSKSVVEEFHTPRLEPLKTLPDRFTSPPLFSGLLQSVHEVLGPDVRPSPIQSLSLKHLFTPPPHIFNSTDTQEENPEKSSLAPTFGEYLLASETGSGKSIAYLLPMIQYLKLTEGSPPPLPSVALPPPPGRSLALNPRGLILAPTHELSRQLSSFAKSLLHNVRLRVLCASRANTSSSSRGINSTASQMKRELDDTESGLTDEAHILKRSRPVDVLVGTPMKVLEMVRGWGWNREDNIEDHWDDAEKDRARNWVPGPPEAGLSKIEWVVIDEADILFDNDFERSTRMLLADIAQARGYTHPSFSTLRTSVATPLTADPSSQPLAYPFHLLLTSATIPSSLASYLTAYHPKLTRLASPNLHRLPSTLKTEYHAWTSGNKNSDIEKRIRHVWSDDARSNTKSKILVFCNKSSKVEDLGLYLKEKGIPNVALTSTTEARFRGSNRHLAGFLKDTEGVSTVESSVPLSRSDPHVLITTSLLSRGLDFSPQIKYVFIADEPRNMIDFLHRAGRSGRAGNEGKVVVFGKMKGRGSDAAREVRRKIGALAH